MKKKIIIVVAILVAIAILIGVFVAIKHTPKKEEPTRIVFKENLEVAFLEDVKVSDFVSEIDGEIIDDEVVDTTEVGPKTLTLNYLDKNGKKKTHTFDINVVDNVEPLIWLSSSYNVKKGNKNFIDKILCGDNADNKPNCYIEGEYDVNKVGKYKVTFKAVDKSGNVATHPFTLNVYEPTSSSGSDSTSPKVHTKFSDVIKEYKNDQTKIGLDVSRWQGDIDFKKIKDAGAEFVIIRVGTKIGTDGDYALDSKFKRNITEAKKYGIPVGLYFYSYANSKEMAIADAEWVIDQIKGYDIDLPIAFDWEQWNYFNEYELSFYGLTSVGVAFMDRLKEEGYDAMLYGSKVYLESMWMKISYPTWLAHYTSKTNYKGDYLLWQMCSNGQIDGINGDVDIDIMYTG